MKLADFPRVCPHAGIRSLGMRHARELAASALWAVAMSVMVFGSFSHNVDALAWGLSVQMIACIVTCWLIVEHFTRAHEVEVERVVEIVAGLSPEVKSASPIRRR